MPRTTVRDILSGAAAGAAGTVALDITTYLDMLIRARPSSGTPASLVDILARTLGMDLAAGAEGAQKHEEAKQTRESALGALLGYVTGLTVGAAYGLVRSQREDVPIPLAMLGVGLAAMATSDLPIIISKASDPKTWGVSGWLSDLVPHLVYGLVTVAAYENTYRSKAAHR